VVNDNTKEDASKKYEEYINDKGNPEQLKQLEQLAEKEHNGWLLDRLKGGWAVHEVKKDSITRNDYHKSHYCMVTYNDLEEVDPEQKVKDRDSIKNYTKLLKDSGFLITHSGD
jgi:hypothetical protein